MTTIADGRPSFPSTPLRILHIAMELAPWASTGGLSEATAGLATAQHAMGDRITVVVPFHGSADWPQWALQTVEGANACLRLGGEDIPFKLSRLKHPGGFEVIAVRSDLYERGGIYAQPDTGAEFADAVLRSSVLCHAALYYALTAGGRWQVIHAHDAAAGLAPALLRNRFQPTPLQHCRSVLTVHDLGRSGRIGEAELRWTGLTQSQAQGTAGSSSPPLSTLGAGLASADWIHTLSPNYAREMGEDPAIGGSFHPLLSERRDQIVGILGGLDLEAWDARTDPHLAASFSEEDLESRTACRDDLLALARLAPAAEGEPELTLVSVVGRLVHRRGLDLLAEVIPGLVGEGFRFLIHADGNPPLEERFADLSRAHPGLVFADNVWDPGLARQILAGSDLYCMPSRYEPWGLIQQYAMRFGTLPVVRRTGGLVDTVPEDVGFFFEDFEAQSLCHALRTAAEIVRDPEARRQRQVRAMAVDRTWSQAAAELRRRVYMAGR